MATTIYQLLGENAGVGLKQRSQFPTEEAETETGSSHCLSEGDLESEKELEHVLPCSTLSFPPGLEPHCSTAAQRGGATVRESPAARKGAKLFSGPGAAQNLLEGLRARGSGVLAQLPQQYRRANKKAPPTQRQQPQQSEQLGGALVHRQQLQGTTVQATRPATAAQSWHQTVMAPATSSPRAPASALEEWILPAPMKVLLGPNCGMRLNLDPTVPVKKKPLLCATAGPFFPLLSPASVSMSQLAMVWGEGNTVNWCSL
eukprot:TRINITY_DN45781_c0_g1_i1.p1 TRINITY_DN45781_c0_g1~~TRINITY_DN45781_c0_g1_i1.p1  ORF type:complete len:259 (+),score=47.00 TRINITY_DN45781_c0_g1_i1:64-840(+)